MVLNKTSKLIIFICTAFVLMSVLSVFPAHADEKTDREKAHEYIKPMPEFEKIPDDVFKQNTALHVVEPFGDKDLAYSVRLPSNWTLADEKSNDEDVISFTSKIFGELSKYFGPVGPKSGFPNRFTVKAIGLPYEMNAEQWLMQYLLSNGYTLQGFEVLNEDRAEALYILLDKDISYVVRTVAVRNGKRIILAQYYMPMEFWKSQKTIQAQVIDSFQLGYPKDELVEKMKDYHFLDIAKFQYPESWILRAKPVRNVDRMGVSLLNLPEGQDIEDDKYVLNGKIEVSLVSVFEGNGLEQEMSDIKTKMEESGLIMDDTIPFVDDIATNENFDFVDTKIYKAVDKDNDVMDYEFWMSVMAYEEYYYFMTMLTPSREHDIYVWARNAETYKLMLGLIGPQMGDIIVFDKDGNETSE